ncbi:MAG TPA: L,D-transpeptidase family protein [Mycobacteriales bacterium]|nr:L,D-transpeptidase family protein [Mycobacteriales bacterium]
MSRGSQDQPVSLRFGAHRRGRLTISIIGMLALMSTAAGTTIAWGRGTPAETVTRIVTQPSPSPSVLAVPSPSVSPSPLASRPAAAAPRRPVAAKPAVPCPRPPAVPTSHTLAASAIGSSLPVFDAPGGAHVRSLPNPTRDHQQLHLRVVENRGDWYRVQMAERPNGVTGWIRAGDVRTSVAKYRILIERCARRMTVLRDGNVVMREPVAVGKGSTPTPLGDFYVDFLEKWRPSSKYGPWLLSVSGFSEVYTSFGKGGVGQIGIHGTQARTSVGRPTSNGCIRMHNEAISVLAQLVTPGTPVLIAP